MENRKNSAFTENKEQLNEIRNIGYVIFKKKSVGDNDLSHRLFYLF